MTQSNDRVSDFIKGHANTHTRYAHYVKTWRHPQNRMYIAYCNASEEDKNTAAANMHK